MAAETKLRASQAFESYFREEIVSRSGIRSSEDPFRASNLIMLIVVVAVVIPISVLLLKRNMIIFRKVVLAKYNYEETENEYATIKAGQRIDVPITPREHTAYIDQRYNPHKSTTVNIPYYHSHEDTVAHTDQGKQLRSLSINLDHVLDRKNRDSIPKKSFAKISSRRSMKDQRGGVTKLSSHTKSRATNFDQNHINTNISTSEGKSLSRDKTETPVTSSRGMSSKPTAADAQQATSSKQHLRSQKQEVPMPPSGSTDGLQTESESHENLYGPSTMPRAPSSPGGNSALDAISNARVVKQEVSMPSLTYTKGSKVELDGHRNFRRASVLSRGRSGSYSDTALDALSTMAMHSLAEFETSASVDSIHTAGRKNETRTPETSSLPTKFAEEQVEQDANTSFFRDAVRKIKLAQQGLSLFNPYGFTEQNAKSDAVGGNTQQQVEQDRGGFLYNTFQSYFSPRSTVPAADNNEVED